MRKGKGKKDMSEVRDEGGQARTRAKARTYE